MVKGVRNKRGHPRAWGLIIGIVFGVLLQKGQVTRYDVIIGQLLLEDFTVVKVMLTAVIVGMIGIHLLASRGVITFQIKQGSWGASVLGGLIFGVGFGLLGYCPGTAAGATGHGSLDALIGGMGGIIFGSGLFSWWYGRLKGGVLVWGDFGEATFPRIIKVNAWAVVAPLACALGVILYLLERYGL